MNDTYKRWKGRVTVTKTITMPLEEYEKLQKDLIKFKEKMEKLRFERYRETTIKRTLKGAIKNFCEQVESSNFRDENDHPLKMNEMYQKLIVADDPEHNSFLAYLEEKRAELYGGESVSKPKVERVTNKTKKEEKPASQIFNITIHNAGKTSAESAKELVSNIQQIFEIEDKEKEEQKQQRVLAEINIEQGGMRDGT